MFSQILINYWPGIVSAVVAVAAGYPRLKEQLLPLLRSAVSKPPSAEAGNLSSALEHYGKLLEVAIASGDQVQVDCLHQFFARHVAVKVGGNK